MAASSCLVPRWCLFLNIPWVSIVLTKHEVILTIYIYLSSNSKKYPLSTHTYSHWPKLCDVYIYIVKIIRPKIWWTYMYIYNTHQIWSYQPRIAPSQKVHPVFGGPFLGQLQWAHPIPGTSRRPSSPLGTAASSEDRVGWGCFTVKFGKAKAGYYPWFNGI